jgi:putative two-component system response regulator
MPTRQADTTGGQVKGSMQSHGSSAATDAAHRGILSDLLQAHAKLDEVAREARHRVDIAGKEIEIALDAHARTYERMAEAHHRVVVRLATAAEERAGVSRVHMARIGGMAEALALACGQSREWSALLREASQWHDIGLIEVAEDLLHKTGGLTAEEWAAMRTHPRRGALLLEGTAHPLFDLAAEIAWTHHEKFDGSGYPRGLRGTDIPLSGRIVAVVDFFDALTMDRSYRPALSVDEACSMIRAQEGRHLDPTVVTAFFETREELMKLRNEINAAGPQSPHAQVLRPAA